MKRVNKNSLPNTEFEQNFWLNDKFVAGIDEAGRGAIAGPVVAASVVLPKLFDNKIGINDSKKLRPEKREVLFKEICEFAITYGIGIIENIEIDRINILRSTLEAMMKSIDLLVPQPDHLFVDGNYFMNHRISHNTIIKGDSKCLSIASASIIAKVTRDKWMTEQAEILYPGYGFAIHKGYGTKQHYEAIFKLGVCPIHRKSFLKKIFPTDVNLF